jgi:hypothetical protein
MFRIYDILHFVIIVHVGQMVAIGSFFEGEPRVHILLIRLLLHFLLL